MSIHSYNAHKPQMCIRRFARAVCLPLVPLLFLTAKLPASNWTIAECDLTNKIAAVTGPAAVSLIVDNRSSLTQGDIRAVNAELRAQFEASGLHVVGIDKAAAAIQLTLSENVQSYVWVARIQQGENAPAIVMVSVPRTGSLPEVRESSPMAIAKVPLWSQANQILDVGVIDSPPRLIILEPERIVLYSRLNSGQWQQDREFPISHVRPWPRDLRGRLLLRKDHLFDAYLPGVLCTASSGTLYMHCNESDDPWPLASDSSPLNAFFSPTRNFFTGVLTPGIGQQRAAPAFYLAAPVARQNYVLWLFTAVDGTIHAMDGMTDLAISQTGWGSDIASVKSTCGLGWQVLATGNSDGRRPDSVRAYQFPDRDPVAVSEAVAMSGPITALWTEESGSSAVAVTRNLRTLQYETFRLAVSCGQ
ncbi:MAG TPA: hypothetical protein VMT53_05645 [Terriglobales bacterium]|nr:hypothetical protein [Terriglobales bacterium]